MLNVSFVTDPALTAGLNPLALSREYRDLGVAVVDLTGLSAPDLTASPALAGWNLATPTTVGSTSKLAVMLAAFELRHIVRAAHALRPADPLGVVTEALVKDWAAASDRESRDVANRPPTFTQIFDASFEFSAPMRTTDELHAIDADATRATVSALSFGDRLRLMTEWSENIASSMCARDLGFAFIKATLLQSGLYTSGAKGEPGKGGLWVGAEFGAGAGNAYAAPPLRGRRDPVGGFIHGGTARSIATLLTALALGRIDGSNRMMDLLKKRGRKEARSFFLEGIAPRVTPPSTTISIWSKIGSVPTPETLSDAAVVEERATGGVTRWYVLVAVGSRGERALEQIQALAGDVHDVIQALYP